MTAPGMNERSFTQRAALREGRGHSRAAHPVSVALWAPRYSRSVHSSMADSIDPVQNCHGASGGGCGCRICSRSESSGVSWRGQKKDSAEASSQAPGGGDSRRLRRGSSC